MKDKKPLMRFDEFSRNTKELVHASFLDMAEAMMNNQRNFLDEAKELQEDFFTRQDKRFESYEDNYRPTHKNKIDIHNYIKDKLGESYEDNEPEKVKARVLIMLGYDKWQDAPYKELVSVRGMEIIDDSIKSVMGFRKKQQETLFDD